MRKGEVGDSVGTFLDEKIEAGTYELQVSAIFQVPDKTVTVIPGTFPSSP
jgi:hypothetical protein